MPLVKGAYHRYIFCHAFEYAPRLNVLDSMYACGKAWSNAFGFALFLRFGAVYYLCSKNTVSVGVMANHDCVPTGCLQKNLDCSRSILEPFCLHFLGQASLYGLCIRHAFAIYISVVHTTSRLNVDHASAMLAAVFTCTHVVRLAQLFLLSRQLSTGHVAHMQPCI